MFTEFPKGTLREEISLKIKMQQGKVAELQHEIIKLEQMIESNQKYLYELKKEAEVKS